MASTVAVHKASYMYNWIDWIGKFKP